MRGTRFSLFNLFAIATCLILLVISIYERNRANEIETKSMVLASPQYRAIVEQDWEIMKRQLQHQKAVSQFEIRFVIRDSHDDVFRLLPHRARRELANIRNSELKLSREKMKLQNMRTEFTTQLLRSTLDR